MRRSAPRLRAHGPATIATMTSGTTTSITGPHVSPKTYVDIPTHGVNGSTVPDPRHAAIVSV